MANEENVKFLKYFSKVIDAYNEKEIYLDSTKVNLNVFLYGYDF